MRVRIKMSASLRETHTQMLIKIERTANATPNRNWDYAAWVDGHEEGGSNQGATPADAVNDLLAYGRFPELEDGEQITIEWLDE